MHDGDDEDGDDDERYVRTIRKRRAMNRIMLVPGFTDYNEDKSQ